jgi:hypothetical protein
MQTNNKNEIRVELEKALKKMMFTDLDVDSIKSISKLIRDDGRASLQFVIGYDGKKNAIKTKPIIVGRKRDDNSRQLRSISNFELMWSTYRHLCRDSDNEGTYFEIEDIDI